MAEERSYRHGVRAVLPLSVAVFGFGISYGVLAVGAGMGSAAPIVMSATTFAGSAQFAAASVLGAAGTAATAILAAVLLNARYLPIGITVAPWITGGFWSRLLHAHLTVDETWAVAAEGQGRWNPQVLIGAGVVLWLAWVGGTVAGVLFGDVIGDPNRWGLDAAFPALFLALLAPQVRDARPAEGRRRRAPGPAHAHGGDRRRDHRLDPHAVHPRGCPDRRREPRVPAGAVPEAGVAMSEVWLVVLVTGIATLAIKAAGPVLLGGRPLPARLDGVVTLLGPALARRAGGGQHLRGEHARGTGARRRRQGVRGRGRRDRDPVQGPGPLGRRHRRRRDRGRPRDRGLDALIASGAVTRYRDLGTHRRDAPARPAQRDHRHRRRAPWGRPP